MSEHINDATNVDILGELNMNTGVIVVKAKYDIYIIWYSQEAVSNPCT